MGDINFKIAEDGEIRRLPEKRENKVFVSHDTRDQNYAKLLCKLIEDASQSQIKTFRSSRPGEIRYGDTWHDTIMNAIGDSDDIICLLTKNSRRKPWILYEAGVARGKGNMKIIGLCIGIKVSTNSPIAIYQACMCEKREELIALMEQIISKNSPLIVTDKTTRSNIEKRVVEFIKAIDLEQNKPTRKD